MDTPEDIIKRSLVICMKGKKGVGKDTVTDMICGMYGIPRISMSDSIRDVVWLYFSYKIKDRTYIWGPTSKKEEVIDENWIMSEKVRIFFGLDRAEPWTGRRLLQFYGNEVGREIDSEVWLNGVLRQVSTVPKGCMAFVLSDGRFVNEFDLFKNAKKRIIVEIKRNTENNIFSSHPSEHSANIEPDVVLENFGDLHQLKSAVEKFIKCDILPQYSRELFTYL